MINKKSVDTVDKSQFSKNFNKPIYDSYSFCKVISTIRYILTGKGDKEILPEDVFGNYPKKYDKVVLILLDAFGWCFLEKYKNKYPFLKRVIKEGVVSKLSSQFPSTTAAHVTTIHTGLSVNEHGVYEWRYYEPKLDDIILPLMFSFSRHKRRDTLKKTGIISKEIYPNENTYSQLKNDGVECYSFIAKEYAYSPYNLTISKGTNLVAFNNQEDAFKKLSKNLSKNKNNSYYTLYFDQIDNAAHHFGPDSKEFIEEVDKCFLLLEKFFREIENKVQNTLLVITADHGQTLLNPKTTIYLNKIWPKIRNYIKRNKNGELLVPAGSCRDMFLYIKDEYLDEVENKLKIILKGKAEVYKTKELEAQNFFGLKKSSAIFKERLGNLVILPYSGEAVWWYKKNVFEQKHLGNHGGLTKEEMEIPLILIPIV